MLLFFCISFLCCICFYFQLSIEMLDSYECTSFDKSVNNFRGKVRKFLADHLGHWPDYTFALAYRFTMNSIKNVFKFVHNVLKFFGGSCQSSTWKRQNPRAINFGPAWNLASFFTKLWIFDPIFVRQKS